MRPDNPVRAYVGLGGNEGDVETTLTEALWALDALPQTARYIPQGGRHSASLKREPGVHQN